MLPAGNGRSPGSPAHAAGVADRPEMHAVLRRVQSRRALAEPPPADVAAGHVPPGVSDDPELGIRFIVREHGGHEPAMPAAKVGKVEGAPIGWTGIGSTVQPDPDEGGKRGGRHQDRKSTPSELQSLMRNSYAVFCLKKKKKL